MTNDSDWLDLKNILLERSFRFGKFILSSGKESSYYFDGKQTTLTPLGAYLCAKIIAGKLAAHRVQSAGGPTLGADPIVGALGAVVCGNHITKTKFP